MSDIVQHVLEVEERAKRIIEQAKKEVARLVEDARQEAQRVQEESRRAARAEAEEMLRARDQEAQQERQRTLEQAARSALGVQSVEPDRLKGAVDRVVRAVAARESDEGA